VVQQDWQEILATKDQQGKAELLVLMVPEEPEEPEE
jgi:hypothetical protein